MNPFPARKGRSNHFCEYFLSKDDIPNGVTKVAPSMLSSDFSKLGEEIEAVENAGADLIHLDVMDGNFVPNITFGAPLIRSIRKCTDLPFDVHLMIEEPSRYIGDFVKAGADLITVHSESRGNIGATLKLIQDSGAKAGITLKPGTPVADIENHLGNVDLVLVMTVQPGFGGQSFREEGLSRIAYLDAYRKENGIRYEISVDGGINRDTGRRCRDAGADILVAGSYLFGLDDMKSEIDIWHSF